MSEQSSAWVDDFARSLHQAFIGMVPSRWSSLNGFEVFKAEQGTFLARIHELVRAHADAGTTPQELWHLFAHPSSLRSAIVYLAWEYGGMNDKAAYRAKAREVFDALNGALYAGMQGDPWALNANRIHSSDEVRRILADTPWNTGDVQTVKDAGKLYVGLASLGFALYRDFFPQESHEIFGPYDASARFGEDATLLVKYFPKLRPVEIWAEVERFPYEEVTIYQVIKGTHFRCEFIGMHSIYDGPVVPNTVAIAVKVGDRFIDLKDYGATAFAIAKDVTEFSHLYEALDVSAAKEKFLMWEAYQFMRAFEAVSLDWKPTPEMLAPVMAADIHMGIAVDSWPSYEEYVSNPKYEVYWLKDLYAQ